MQLSEKPKTDTLRTIDLLNIEHADRRLVEFESKVSSTRDITI
jgi:hypothetical protein